LCGPPPDDGREGSKLAATPASWRDQHGAEFGRAAAATTPRSAVLFHTRVELDGGIQGGQLRLAGAGARGRSSAGGGVTQLIGSEAVSTGDLGCE
jgi:hypothetical protein